MPRGVRWLRSIAGDLVEAERETWRAMAGGLELRLENLRIG